MGNIKEFIKGVEEKWNKLPVEAQAQFWLGIDGDFSKVTDAGAYELAKEYYDFENKLREEQMKKESGLVQKGTTAVEGTEIVDCDEVALTVPTKSATLATRQEMPTAEWIETVKALHASGFFPDIRSAAQAIAKAQAGRELGLQPYYSLQHLFILPGKPPALDAQAMGMLIKRAGYEYRVVKTSGTECVIKFFGLKGEEIGESTFTITEASKIMQGGKRLIDKDVWRNYPSDLLFARCLSRGYRRFCPHLGVVYLREEIDAEDSGQPEKTDLSEFKVDVVSTPEVVLPINNRQKQIDDLKLKHGVPRIKEVLKNHKIEGKLADLTEENFKIVVDALNVVTPIIEKVKEKLKEPTKEKTKVEEPILKEEKPSNSEIVNGLIAEFGKEKCLKVKKELNITGSAANLEEKEFKAYCKAVKA
jgi:hypothetical protein